MTGPERLALEELRRAVRAAREGCVAEERAPGRSGGARRVWEALRWLNRVSSNTGRLHGV